MLYWFCAHMGISLLFHRGYTAKRAPPCRRQATHTTQQAHPTALGRLTTNTPAAGGAALSQSVNSHHLAYVAPL